MTRTLPALPQQTSRRVLELARLKIREKPKEVFESVRFRQAFDLSELKGVLEDMDEQEYHEAHQDEEKRILDHEGRCIVDELSEKDWEEFDAPMELPAPADSQSAALP
jgi:hypothetical protein